MANNEKEQSILVPAVTSKRRDMRSSLLGGALVLLGVGTGFSMANLQTAFHQMERVECSASAPRVRTQAVVQPRIAHRQAHALLGIEFQQTQKGFAVVRKVFPNSPAATLDLKPGDSIVAVNGDSVVPYRGDLRRLIRRYRIGDSVKLEVIRGKNYEHKDHDRILDVRLGNSEVILRGR